MSFLRTDGSTIYDHLDEGDPFTVVLDVEALAKRIEEMNYGTVRLLGALLRVRKVKLTERIAKYREKGDHDIAESVARRGDAIAAAIERLLLAEEF
jgi:hypothetical protein